MKNYIFMSDYATVTITAPNKKEATKILKETVIHFDHFHFEEKS